MPSGLSSACQRFSASRRSAIYSPSSTKGLIQASDLAVAPDAGAIFSSSATSAPAWAQCIAIDAPRIPPPTMPILSFARSGIAAKAVVERPAPAARPIKVRRSISEHPPRNRTLAMCRSASTRSSLAPSSRRLDFSTGYRTGGKATRHHVPTQGFRLDIIRHGLHAAVHYREQPRIGSRPRHPRARIRRSPCAPAGGPA